MKKPISPAVHGIIDYAFAALLMAGPTLFKLKGLARKFAYGLGSNVAAYSATTDYPTALQRKIPLSIHKKNDERNLAALLFVPMVTGMMKKRRAKYFFLGLLAAGVTTVLLTDWKKEEIV